MKIKFILLTMIITSFSFQNLFSQSEVFFIGHQFGVGARAMSLGGAFSAVADDYTATYWNPAGLTQIRRMEFTGAMSHFMMKSESTFRSSTTIDETNATKLNAIGFVFPYPTYRGSLVFAIGYNRVKTFDSGFTYQGLFNSESDSAYKQTYTELENGSLTNWVFSGAIEMTQNLSVGVSLNIWRGNDDYQWISEYDELYNINYYDQTDELSIKTDYSSVNFKLGALYRMGILGRISATISTPVKLRAEESWLTSTLFYDNYDPLYADSTFYEEDNGNWDYSIKSPYTFSVGAAFTLFPNLIVAGDLEYSDWSQLQYTSEPPVGSLGETNRYFKRNYHATTQVRLRAEFTIPLINLQLRGGFFNQPSPLIDAPSSADRKYLTAGVGLLLDKQVKLDLTWLRGWWTDENYLSEEIPSVTEDTVINKLLATVAFRF